MTYSVRGFVGLPANPPLGSSHLMLPIPFPPASHANLSLFYGFDSIDHATKCNVVLAGILRLLSSL